MAIFALLKSQYMENINNELNILKAIKAVIKEYPNGAQLKDILEKSNLNISRRTILRKLEILEKNKEITSRKAGRSSRYFLTEEQGISKEQIEKSQNVIPLSEESKKILENIRKPIEQRTPVGYHREFLENYIPNQDSYLNETDKKLLADLGNTNQLKYPAGTYAREILNRLLIDLSWNSSRMEGNTYSLLETERLILLGKSADEKSNTETQMILNHKGAIEFLVENAEDEDININRYTILSLHGILSDNLLPDPTASGRLRRISVGINKSVFTPLGIPQSIEEMFNLMLNKAQQIKDPYEQMFFVMVHLPYLQPFDDVNKRVSRLAANIPLIKRNLAPLSFIDVPNDIYVYGLLCVYELNRIELLKDVFIWAYKKSSDRYSAVQQSIGKPDEFRLKYRNELRTIINKIVTANNTSKQASESIRQFAINIMEEDRSKFSELVEQELISLHEGSFARYYISPSEFKSWKESWQKG